MKPVQLSLGLGIFSIGLGAAELIATRRIASALGQNDRPGRAVLRVFGVREIVAGAALLAAPAHSGRMWNRVVGDALDLGTLGMAAVRSPKRPALWGAIAFVTSAAMIDMLVARRLDQQTGALLPPSDNTSFAQDDQGTWTSGKSGHPTTIEPEDMPLVEGPEVPTTAFR
ncbi:hypothetical protein [Sphingobium yanoikuyae]|uniref:hypothetical protein n=1 Tax=Sphingobium yanoikuyae TaxID=13690 RepID=UPI001C0EFE04|nr:hypothetical protein [Sphingobium yanoikuyae]